MTTIIARSAQPVEAPPASDHVRLLAIMTGALVWALWLVPLSSSLWLDELGTWWVVKDGLGDTVHRALTFHGQSPLYYVIVWIARHVGGNSEVVLRLPSLLAAAASAFLLYRLARTLISKEAALLAVLVFAATNSVAFEASEARPYAIANLAVIASTYALVRWLDQGQSWRPAIVYALIAASVVWMHYLFALVLVPQAVYALVRLRRGQTEVPGRRMVAVAMVVVAAMVPLAVQLASLWDRRASLSIPADATALDFAVALLPPVLVASLFLGSLIARTRGPLRISPVPARPSTLVLLGSWILFPIVTLFLVSALTPLTFLSPRYYVSAAPAAALLAGWAIAALQPATARRAIAMVLVLLSVLAFGGALKNGEDWRGAAAFERAHAGPDTIVLLHPALVESAQLDWFTDPVRRSYLLSVTSYYPIDGRVMPMPYILDADARAYLEGLVTGPLSDADRFLLVTRYPQVPFREWLDGRLTASGYRSRVIATFGVIQVIEFARST